MEQDQTIAEDGEILDEEPDNNYIPLERPTNYSTTASTHRFGVQQPPQQQPLPLDTESEDELSSSSDSDSDSDCMVYKVKKPKIKLKKPKVPRIQNQNPKRKKYDIWSTRAQEDVLVATLNSCDVTYKDRSRDVESYDYTIAQKVYGGGDNKASNKRSRADRNNANLRLRKRSPSVESDTNRVPRHILDLTVTCDNTTDEIGLDIANKLYEGNEDLMKKIVEIAGKTKAIELFKETQRIEAEGGLMIMNNTRKRTPGGVFIRLTRRDPDLTRDQLEQIFYPSRQKHIEAIKLQKKMKLDKLKKINALSKSSDKDLPDLLTRAELCVQRLAKENDRTRKESSNVDVINPPPTPEMEDCHDNSCDAMEQTVNDDSGRKLENYEVDFLDIGNTNTMDLF